MTTSMMTSVTSTSAKGPTGPSANASAARDRVPADRAGNDSSAAFERALRDRAARLEEKSSDDDTGGEGEHEGNDGTPAFAMARQELPRAMPATPAGHASTAVDFTPEGTRAAMQAALNSNAPVAPLTGASEAAQTWQVSLNEPGGAIDVQATRLDRSGMETRSAWSLSIATPALATDAIARHVAQLTDRLRARGIDAAHVRVETRDHRDGDEDRQGNDGGNGRQGSRR